MDTPQIIWHGGEKGRNDPIFTCDSHELQFGADSKSAVLVTGGTDGDVRLWSIIQPTEENQGTGSNSAPIEVGMAPPVVGKIPLGSQTFLASLSGHDRSVNVARFSPDGLSLASAGDGGTIMVYTVQNPQDWINVTGDKDTSRSIVSSTAHDIYDISWSPDSRYLTCGTVDNSTHIVEVKTRKLVANIKDHMNYVQGTAWDPNGELLATQSNDRTCRIYSVKEPEKGQLSLKCDRVVKAAQETKLALGGSTPAAVSAATSAVPRPPAPGTPGKTENLTASTTPPTEVNGTTPTTPAATVVPSVPAVKPKCQHFYTDEALFFRRLAWTPDGQVLITPSALRKDLTSKRSAFCTYLFTRGSFGSPSLCLGGLEKPSIAVRCCPLLFSLRFSSASSPSKAVTSQAENCANEVTSGQLTATSTPGSTEKAGKTVPRLTDLPYRMLIAVATQDAVIVYDTESKLPLAFVGGLHLASHSDICWLPGATGVIVTSVDGYLSKIMFSPGELGTPLPVDDVPAKVKQAFPLTYGITSSVPTVTQSPRKVPSSVPANTVNTPAKSTADSTVNGAGDVPNPNPPSGNATGSQVKVLETRPKKKKIVPTPVLVSKPSPAAKPVTDLSAGDDDVMIIENPTEKSSPASSTVPATIPAVSTNTVAVPPSSSEPVRGPELQVDSSGISPGTQNKVKRRIAPTAVIETPSAKMTEPPTTERVPKVTFALDQQSPPASSSKRPAETPADLPEQTPANNDVSAVAGLQSPERAVPLPAQGSGERKKKRLTPILLSPPANTHTSE